MVLVWMSVYYVWDIMLIKTKHGLFILMKYIKIHQNHFYDGQLHIIVLIKMFIVIIFYKMMKISLELMKILLNKIIKSIVLYRWIIIVRWNVFNYIVLYMQVLHH